MRKNFHDNLIVGSYEAPVFVRNVIVVRPGAGQAIAHQ